METLKEVLNEYEMANSRKRFDMWLIFREMRVLFDEVEQRTTESPLLNLNEFFSTKYHRRRDKKGQGEVSQLKNIFQLKESVYKTSIPIHRKLAMADIMDCKTGKLLNQVKEAFKLIESFKGLLVGSETSRLPFV